MLRPTNKRLLITIYVARGMGWDGMGGNAEELATLCMVHSSGSKIISKNGCEGPENGF
jgi:hypothetical protein